MRAWVEVFESDGVASSVTDGPIYQVRSWRQLSLLNGAGNFSCVLNALDERAASLIHPLSVLRCKVLDIDDYLPSVERVKTLGTVIVHSVSWRVVPDGTVDLVVSGADSLYDLTKVLVEQTTLTEDETLPHDALMDRYAPPAWGWSGAYANPVALQFSYETLLDALGQVSEVNGDRFRGTRDGFALSWISSVNGHLAAPNMPTIVASLDPQVVLTDAPSGALLGTNRDTLLATSLEIGEDGYNIATHCFAFGSGIGINRLHLNYATHWPDDSLISAGNYTDELGIEWQRHATGMLINLTDAVIIGTRYVHKYWPQIVPASVNTPDYNVAGNTLMKFALSYMRSVRRATKVYRATIVKPMSVSPNGYVGNYASLVYVRGTTDGIPVYENVEALLVTEAEESIDERGVYTVRLTMIDAERPPKTESQYILEMLRTNSMALKNDQFTSQDLGTSEAPLRVVYSESIVSSGGIPLSGSEWEYSGNMLVDANAGSDTIVQIANQGAGRADLYVDRNIVLGGTVNGVDIASLVGSGHPAATGGDGIDVDGAQVVAVDATVVRTSRSVATGDGLSGGGNLSANRTLTVDTSVVRTSRSIVAGTGLTGGGFLSADVTLNVIGGDGITANANDVAVDATVVRTSRQVIAGAGMTGGGALSADVTLNVIAGNGIVVGANDVAVLRATPDSGLTFVSGGLALGAPGAVSALTTAAVTTTTHVHPVIAANDVGTIAPGVETLLKATGAGALTLGSLDVTGSANILQSLYAAASGFQVLHHTAGGAHAHVLVNPSGDPVVIDEQFGMDIYDNLRVRGYIVGNLTLQVRDMDPVIPFDGAFPLESNYTGSTLGSGGQAGRAATGCRMPIFRPGRFGKAVQITSAGTNLFTNPTAEIDDTSYANTGSATRTVVTTHSYFGAKSIRVQTTSGAFDGLVAIGPTHGSAQTYSAIVWIERTEIVADLIVGLREATATQIAFTTIPKRLGWQPVSVSGTTTTTGSLRLYIQKSGGAAVVVFYVDGASMYLSANCLPSAHGAMTTNEGSDAYSWTGAAHGSTTTILKTGLVYPSTSPIHTVGANGSFGAWVRLPWAGSGSGSLVHYVFTAGNNNLSLRFDASGQVIFQAGGSDATPHAITLDTQWHLYMVTWADDTNLVQLWYDGVVIASHAYVGPTTSSDMYIGCNTAGDAQLDGQIDHVMNVSRVLDAEEMLAIATADGPAFAFRSVFNLRFGRNRFSFDDEGFWGTGASGRRLIGIYAGVDGAPSTTKSWGNVNLSEGDILFGQKATLGGGWMHFDQAVTALGETPRMAWGYDGVEVLQLDTGGATLNGVLDLSATGGIFQGTGTFAEPDDALKIYNNSGVGNIELWVDLVKEAWLDAQGFAVRRPVFEGDYSTLNSYKFMSGSATVGGVTGLLSNSSTQNNAILWAEDTTSGRQAVAAARAYGTSANVYAEIVATRRGTGARVGFVTISALAASTLLNVGADQSDFYGALHATGAADFDGTLNADGVVTFGSTLNVVGALSAASLAVGSVVLTGNLTVPNAMRINVETLRAIDTTGLLFQNAAGTTGMFISNAGNVVVPTGQKFATDAVAALSAAGLLLSDDANDPGVFVADLGAVAVGHLSPDSGTRFHAKGSSGLLTTAPFKFETTLGGSLGSTRAVLSLKATTTGVASAAFGPRMIFELNDSDTSGVNVIAALAGVRDGADNSGRLVFSAAAAGVLVDVLTLRADSTIVLGGPVNSQVAGTVSLIVDSPASPTGDILRVLRATVERFTITKEGWGKFVSTAASGGGVDDVGARLILQSVKGSAGAAYDMAGQLRFMAKNSSSVDKVFVDVNGQVDVATAGSERGGLYINTQHGGADAIPFAAVGANVRMASSSLSAVNFHGTKGVIFIENRATAPSPANPPSNGIFLYAEGGVLKYMDSSGSVWTA